MGLRAHIPSRQRGKAHCLEDPSVHALSDLHGLHLLILLILLVISVSVGTSNTQGGRILRLALLLEARAALQK